MRRLPQCSSDHCADPRAAGRTRLSVRIDCHLRGSRPYAESAHRSRRITGTSLQTTSSHAARTLMSQQHVCGPPLRLHPQESRRTRRVLRRIHLRRRAPAARPHNEGLSHHTSRHRPWRTLVVIEFDEEEPALRFERYLKTGLGREFARRHCRQTVGAGKRSRLRLIGGMATLQAGRNRAGG